MNLNSNLIVVSAFLRNAWLSVELVKRGYNVYYLDLTNFFQCKPLDWAGPYGFFYHNRLDKTYLEFIQESFSLTENPSGYSLLLENGPLDFKGSLSQFLLKKNGVTDLTIDYIKEFYKQENEILNSERLFRMREEKNFERQWLAQFSHLLADQQMKDNVFGLDSGTPLPVFSRFFSMQPQRDCLARTHNWLERSGVKMINSDELKSLQFSMEKKSKAFFEGIEDNQSFIWGLTSDETAHISKELTLKLFDAVRSPEWIWVRYSVKTTKLYQENYLFNLPHLTLIKDRYLSLCYENFLTLIQSSEPTVYDLWVLVPLTESKKENYLKTFWQKKIQPILDEKWSKSCFEIIEFPEIETVEEENVYFPNMKFDASIDSHVNNKMRIENGFASSPDGWQRGDWHGRYLFQNEFLKNISNPRSEN